jgi:CheY-like chemotaxis protein
MNRRVLFIDDEPHILKAYRIRLAQRFDFVTALGAEKALEILEAQPPFAVVLTDMRMPGMDGIELLDVVRNRWPDAIRMMLTGNADLQTAIDAVNRGQVFRFLTKPCDHELLGSALDDGIEMFRLAESEKVLLTQTLHGVIRVLTDLLALVHPLAFGRTSRLRRYIRFLDQRDAPIGTRWSLELAAMLCQTGCIAMPEDLLERFYAEKPLDDEEQQICSRHAELASELVRNIPRLEQIAAVIAAQDRPLGPASPADETALHARVLKTLIEFDKQMLLGQEPDSAAYQLGKRPDLADGQLVKILADLPLRPGGMEQRFCRIHELDGRMILAQDVRARNGRLLVASGVEVTAPLRMHLARWARKIGIEEPIRVSVPADQAA